MCGVISLSATFYCSALCTKYPAALPIHGAKSDIPTIAALSYRDMSLRAHSPASAVRGAFKTRCVLLGCAPRVNRLHIALSTDRAPCGLPRIDVLLRP